MHVRRYSTAHDPVLWLANFGKRSRIERGKLAREGIRAGRAWALDGVCVTELMMLQLLITTIKRESEADASRPEVRSLRVKQRKP